MAQIRIGFFGVDNTDFILYLARLLAASERKVALVDYTKKLSLLNLTSLPEKLADGQGFYKDVLMLKGDVDNSKDIKNQDVLLYNYGYHMEFEKEQEINIYTTDMLIYSAELLRTEDSERNGSGNYLIVKNHLPLKYDEVHLAELTGKVFEKENIYIMPYDELDYKAKCYIGMDKKQRISSLSKPMKETLISLYEKILATEATEIERKELAKLLKRA